MSLLALFAGAVLFVKNSGTVIISARHVTKRPVGAAMVPGEDESLLKITANLLLEAASNMAIMAGSGHIDDNTASFLDQEIDKLRDLASIICQPEEDFGGTNVVPFRPRAVS